MSHLWLGHDHSAISVKGGPLAPRKVVKAPTPQELDWPRMSTGKPSEGVVGNMRQFRTTKSFGAGLFASALLLTMVPVATATAATDVQSGIKVSAKTITCYKGSATKKVTAANPKCPTGWSTKKPATASKSVALNLTFDGTGQLVWSGSDVQVPSLSGKGGSSTLGLTTLTGTGSANPQSQCTSIRGSGQISGSGGSITFKMDSKSQACGADDAAPTTVSLNNATATVSGGTGKYAGATGTLKVTGSFKIGSTAAGTKETQSFKATFTGTITTK